MDLARRMRTLIELAELIDTQEIYPTAYEMLTSLYGIGHYTASSYLSLHMNIRAVLVDANIARWLARLTGLAKPTDVRRCTRLWELADSHTPEKQFKEYNYAVLDFSMTICKPKKPDCDNCPLIEQCEWASNKGTWRNQFGG